MPDPSSRSASRSTRPDSTTQAIVEVLLDPSAIERRTARRDRFRQLAGYLGLSGTGFGMAAAVACFRSGLWWEGAIALGVTLGLTVLVILGQFAKSLTDRILDKIEERLEERVEPLATWVVDCLELWLTGLWWRLSSPFEKRYTRSLIYAYRDFRTDGIRTHGPFALDLEKVFVPLRVAPESLDHIPSDMIRATDSAESLHIWDFLAVVKRQPAFQRLVIIGAPGAGKSTLLEHLALTYAKRTQRAYHRKAPKLLPILLYLRDVREAIAENPKQDLAALLEQHPKIHALSPPPQWFQQQLTQRNCLVMLDGLDEVANPDQRLLVSAWVDQQIQTYPNAVFILTSRPYGYRSAPLVNAGTLLEVQPFNLPQMQQFIQNWYLQNELMRRLGQDDPGVRATAATQAEDLSDRIQRNAPLAAMATNPLLLTMIATVHCFRGALPGRRVELYAEICDVLLGRRQYAKGIDGALTANQKKSVLQVLALNRMRHRTEEFTSVAGGVVIQPQLAAVSGDAVYAEEFLQHIESGSGLLVEDRAGIYKFAHRSFLEYLAAVQIKESNQELLLTRYIDDPWWEETIRLYAAQQDASNLIWSALQKQTVQSLSLAYDCMREALSVGDREVRRELDAMLEEGLESLDPNLFRLAVEVRLSRRLKALLRVDEQIDADPDLITCAEYQLFINEMRQSGSNRYPDHWQSDRFPLGQGNQPMSGVRGQDATEFCEWLTYRFSNLGDLYLEGGVAVFVGTVRFRLPTVKEAIAAPTNPFNPQATEQKQDTLSIGYWCTSDQETLIHALVDQDVARWLTHLQQAGQEDTDRILKLTQSLKIPPMRLRTASRHAPHPLTRDRELSLNFCRDRAFQRILTKDIPLDENLKTAFNLSDVVLLEHGDHAAFVYEVEHVGDRYRALLPSLTYAKNHALILTGDRTLEHHHDLAFLRAYTPLVAILWHDLADICDRMSRNNRLLRLNQLSRQQCQRLAETYAANVDAAFNLYAFWILVDERRHQRLPTWEGIRIVREQR